MIIPHIYLSGTNLEFNRCQCSDTKAEVPLLWPSDGKSQLIPWGWERLGAKGEEGGRE